MSGSDAKEKAEAALILGWLTRQMDSLRSAHIDKPRTINGILKGQLKEVVTGYTEINFSLMLDADQIKELDELLNSV